MRTLASREGIATIQSLSSILTVSQTTFMTVVCRRDYSVYTDKPDELMQSVVHLLCNPPGALTSRPSMYR